MGYACPVCEDPQADAEHLANHLAFTALARGGDHEAWLDERVPEWGSFDEATLAERVTEHADEWEFPQLFEDTTRPDAHDHDDRDRESAPALGDARDALADIEGDADEEVLERAKELTRKRREDSETE